MRKFVCNLAVVMIAGMSLCAAAQTMSSSNDVDKVASKVSVFGGYSLLHYSNGTDIPLYGKSLGPGQPFTEPKITANGNGFVVSAAYNFTDYFAVVGEYGNYHANSLNNTGTLPAGESITANMQTYLFGIKASSTSDKPVKTFVQILIGVASGTVMQSYAGASVTGPRANSVAAALGGGVEWKVSRHVSIRPGQAEYIITRFPNANTLTDALFRLGDGGDNMQNSFRYSAGVVYNF